MIIGPSNGWLYAKKIYSLFQQEIIFKKAGANAVEISFMSEWFSDENKRRMASLEAGRVFDPEIFIHQSLHLPDVNGQESEQEFAIVQKIITHCNATVVLTHLLKAGNDYPVKIYEEMISKGVPLAIENMDSNKQSGFKLKELKKIAEIVPRFVLDVQHAFEHDSTMEYAFDLFETTKDKLVYLHVSGETEDNHHALVCQSRNCDKIVSFLGTIYSEIQVPIILEGKYSNSEELSQEITFLTKEISD